MNRLAQNVKKAGIPDFLNRHLPHKPTKQRVLIAPRIDTGPQRLDRLTPQAQKYFQEQRMSPHWLEDDSTVAAIEYAAANQLTRTAMPPEIKAQLKEKKLAERAANARPSNLVHVATIAKSLSIISREARAALRGMKKVKGKWGWWFTPEEAKRLTGEMQRYLAAQAKKAKPEKKAKRKSVLRRKK